MALTQEQARYEALPRIGRIARDLGLNLLDAEDESRAVLFVGNNLHRLNSADHRAYEEARASLAKSKMDQFENAEIAIRIELSVVVSASLDNSPLTRRDLAELVQDWISRQEKVTVGDCIDGVQVIDSRGLINLD